MQTSNFSISHCHHDVYYAAFRPNFWHRLSRFPFSLVRERRMVPLKPGTLSLTNWTTRLEGNRTTGYLEPWPVSPKAHWKPCYLAESPHILSQLRLLFVGNIVCKPDVLGHKMLLCANVSYWAPVKFLRTRKFVGSLTFPRQSARRVDRLRIGHTLSSCGVRCSSTNAPWPAIRL
jgi:hypothetical protein